MQGKKEEIYVLTMRWIFSKLVIRDSGGEGNL